MELVSPHFISWNISYKSMGSLSFQTHKNLGVGTLSMEIFSFIWQDIQHYIPWELLQIYFSLGQMHFYIKEVCSPVFSSL